MNAARAIECSACGHAYSSGTWAELPVVRTLTSGDLHAYVSTWEDARVIEVRACVECGRSMARTTTRAA
jgi:Zn ribbon nucleic-acid-binding protein